MNNHIQGGYKAAAKLKGMHGEDYYQKLGAIGGRTPKTRPAGFAAMSRERVAAIGRKGGSVSRRRKRAELA